MQAIDEVWSDTPAPGSHPLAEHLLPWYSGFPSRLRAQIYPSPNHLLWPANFILSFSDGSDGQESACNAGDLGLIPESGRSPGKGNDYSLQYPCLENSMDKGALQATVHGVTKSQT